MAVHESLISPRNAAFFINDVNDEFLLNIIALYQSHLGGGSLESMQKHISTGFPIEEFSNYLTQQSSIDWRIGSRWSTASKLQLLKIDGSRTESSSEIIVRFYCDLNDFNYDIPGMITDQAVVDNFHDHANRFYQEVFALLKEKNIRILDRSQLV